MQTYILGPFLSLLPARARTALSFMRVNWVHAAVASGFLEFIICLAAFAKWYFICMNTWVNRGLDAALSGKTGNAPITDHAIGAAALLIWATHPLTWLFAFFSAEGAVRFCGAAFSDSILGTFPLFVLAKIFGLFVPAPKNADDLNVAASFFSAMSDKWSETKHPAGPDEVVARREDNEEFLEIRSSRRKPDWDPPRTVRIKDTYYRLEASSRDSGPRSYLYTLRKLPVGVPGRSVLLYDPDESAVLSHR